MRDSFGKLPVGLKILLLGLVVFAIVIALMALSNHYLPQSVNVPLYRYLPGAVTVPLLRGGGDGDDEGPNKHSRTDGSTATLEDIGNKDLMRLIATYLDDESLHNLYRVNRMHRVTVKEGDGDMRKIVLESRADAVTVPPDFAPGKRQAFSMAFSADGTRVAVSVADADDVMLYNTHTGERLHTLTHGKYARMAFTDDGKVLASVGGGFVCIWNAESGEQIDTQRYSYESLLGDNINSVQFDARGERLIFVAPLNGDRHLFMCTLGAEGHLSDPESLAGYMWSASIRPDGPDGPDGQAVAMGTFTGFLTIMNLGTGDTEHVHDNRSGTPIDHVTYSPDGSRLAACTSLEDVYLYDFATRTGRSINVHLTVTALAFSADGDSVVVGVGARLLVFDFATGDASDNLQAERSLLNTGRCISIRTLRDDGGEAIVMAGFESEKHSGWIRWKPAVTFEVLQRRRREEMLRVRDR